MDLAEHAIFKLVTLRRSIDDLTIDPGNDVGNSKVLRLLDGLEINPATPCPEVRRLIEGRPILGNTDLETLGLARIQRVLSVRKNWSLDALQEVQIDQANLSTVVDTPEFTKSYGLVTDSWLVLRLKRQDEQLQRLHETLIRVAHLCLRLRHAPDSLRDVGRIDRILQAHVVLPRQWRPARYRIQKLTEKYVNRLATIQPPVPVWQEKMEQKPEVPKPVSEDKPRRGRPPLTNWG